MSGTANAVANNLDPLSAVVLDLHRFVSDVQRPKLANSSWTKDALARCKDLSHRVAGVRGAAGSHKAAAAESVDRLAESLRAYGAELAESPRLVRLKMVSRRLAEDYEDLRKELREFQRTDALPIRMPHVKAVTWARSVFHATMGLAGALLYHFVLTRGQAVGIMSTIAVMAASLEVSRRFSRRWNRFLVERVFGRVARPWERHRTNSATWYTAGLLLVALVMPKVAAEVGILALAFGDPAASLVGQRWGTRKLWHDKSFAGTAAFAMTVLGSTMAVLWLYAPERSIASRFAVSVVVAVVGALVELFSERLDDNFTIPVLCSGVAALWFL